MTSTAPQVPIEVNPDTGVWTTNGMPMIYMPRHFYVNHHNATEQVLGREAFGQILYEAGVKSALQWCAAEAQTHGLRGTAVFRHYMKRVSQRGWGQFSIPSLDEATGEASVRLDHSVYVLQGNSEPADHPRCYAFAGWFGGALEWCGRDSGFDWALTARETHCAAMGTHDHCLFNITPHHAERE